MSTVRATINESNKATYMFTIYPAFHTANIVSLAATIDATVKSTYNSTYKVPIYSANIATI
jgi:hypothetical protein